MEDWSTFLKKLQIYYEISQSFQRIQSTENF